MFCLPVTKKNQTLNVVENCLNSESQEISSLFMYLILFLEYNTPLPSSAPVERLFSTDSIVMTVKRFKLSDDLFEQLVILKQNKVYTYLIFNCVITYLLYIFIIINYKVYLLKFALIFIFVITKINVLSINVLSKCIV